MSVKIYNKLVRDLIPEIVAQAGKVAECEILSDSDYIEKLDAKLVEELNEYLESSEVEELADLLEVLYAAAAARGCPREELEKIRAEKAAKRGAFEKKLLLRQVVDED